MTSHVEKSDKQMSSEANVEHFHKDLGPFVVAAETTRMAMVFTDANTHDNSIIFANDSFLKLTGYDRDEVLGHSFNFLMASGANQNAVPEIESAFRNERDVPDPLVQYRRKDGSVFWATVFVHPVRDTTGAIIQHFASFADVTKLKMEQDRLLFLLDELNHRTQNTLAAVLGIAAQTLHGATAEDVLRTFEDGILALANVQSLLGRKNWENVGIREVLERILAPFGLNDSRTTHFSITGINSRFKPKVALTLGMVFHELATNAMKHGALSPDFAGRIDISWKVERSHQGDRMRFRWQETGGPFVLPPTRKGFGSRLIERGLAQEIGGEVCLDYKSSGVICDIVMPFGGND